TPTCMQNVSDWRGSSIRLGRGGCASTPCLDFLCNAASHSQATHDGPSGSQGRVHVLLASCDVANGRGSCAPGMRIRKTALNATPEDSLDSGGTPYFCREATFRPNGRGAKSTHRFGSFSRTKVSSSIGICRVSEYFAHRRRAVSN